MSKRDFRVSVAGHLVACDVWRVEARLLFPDGVDPQAPTDRVLGEGRLALIEGIIREGLRGRTLGATACSVVIDINGKVRELEIGDLSDPKVVH